MSSVEEIEAAVRSLTTDEKQRLLVLIAQSLRSDGRDLPPPRQFTVEEMRGWMDEDAADLKRLAGGEDQSRPHR